MHRVRLLWWSMNKLIATGAASGQIKWELGSDTVYTSPTQIIHWSGIFQEVSFSFLFTVWSSGHYLSLAAPVRTYVQFILSLTVVSWNTLFNSYVRRSCHLWSSGIYHHHHHHRVNADWFQLCTVSYFCCWCCGHTILELSFSIMKLRCWISSLLINGLLQLWRWIIVLVLNKSVREAFRWHMHSHRGHWILLCASFVCSWQPVNVPVLTCNQHYPL